MIPAGGSGTLTAEVRTHANQRGRLRKVITVTTDDPLMQTVQLQVELEVRPAVEVTPRGPVTLRGRPGSVAEATVRLRRTDGGPLRVTVRPRPERAAVRAEVVPQREGDDPSVVTVRLRAQIPASPARRTEVVELATGHPDAGPVRIRVTVAAELPIAAVPPRVVISPGAPQARVRVRSTGGRPFRITGVTATPAALLAATVPRGAARVHPEHVVEVRLRVAMGSGLPPTPVHGALEVRTDLPGGERLVVPVTVTPVRPRVRRRIQLPAGRAVPLVPTLAEREEGGSPG